MLSGNPSKLMAKKHHEDEEDASGNTGWCRLQAKITNLLSNIKQEKKISI